MDFTLGVMFNESCILNNYEAHNECPGEVHRGGGTSTTQQGIQQPPKQFGYAPSASETVLFGLHSYKSKT